MRFNSLALLGLITLPLVACAATDTALKPYPDAEPGYSRQVIHLPEKADEEAFKLEILAGKTEKVDCNHHWMGGQLEEVVVEGWGYPYYRLSSLGPQASTMMACLQTELQERFIPVVGDGFLMRYNSKLPVVVYVPEGIEVRYRVWSAADEIGQAVSK